MSQDERDNGRDQRRGVLRTAVILAVVAISIYGYFIARGIFGG